MDCKSRVVHAIVRTSSGCPSHIIVGLVLCEVDDKYIVAVVSNMETVQTDIFLKAVSVADCYGSMEEASKHFHEEWKNGNWRVEANEADIEP